MIAPATLELVRQLYPEVPKSFRGVVSLRDGEVVGVAGVFLDHGKRILFAKVTDRTSRKDIIRGARMLLTEGPIYAIRDTCKATAEGFIRHFGFTHVTDEVWVWNN